MNKLIKRYATKCVACSDIAGDYFFGGIQYDILYNGIDVDKYRCDKKTAEGTTFVTVGRFSPPKRPLFIIQLFDEILKRKPDARLKWVGNGELFQEVKQKAEELKISDKVELLGVRSDVNEILKASDYFLLPSAYEGLSLALAEAQAAGLDCFVSDTVSKMSDCGKCMFIPLEKNASEWADLICQYIDGDTRMVIDAEKLADFDIAEMTKRLERFYASKSL
jgi:glycosyltransferase involved in cell wall biosynthesis